MQRMRSPGFRHLVPSVHGLLLRTVLLAHAQVAARKEALADAGAGEQIPHGGGGGAVEGVSASPQRGVLEPQALPGEGQPVGQERLAERRHLALLPRRHLPRCPAAGARAPLVFEAPEASAPGARGRRLLLQLWHGRDRGRRELHPDEGARAAGSLRAPEEHAWSAHAARHRAADQRSRGDPEDEAHVGCPEDPRQQRQECGDLEELVPQVQGTRRQGFAHQALVEDPGVLARLHHAEGVPPHAQEPHRLPGRLPRHPHAPQGGDAPQGSPHHPEIPPWHALRPSLHAQEASEGCSGPGHVPRRHAAQGAQGAGRRRGGDPVPLPRARRQEVRQAPSRLHAEIANELAALPGADRHEAPHLRAHRGGARAAPGRAPREARGCLSFALPAELAPAPGLRAVRGAEAREGRGGQADEHDAGGDVQRRCQPEELHPPVVASSAEGDPGGAQVHQESLAAHHRPGADHGQVGERGDWQEGSAGAAREQPDVQPDGQGPRLGLALVDLDLEASAVARAGRGFRPDDTVGLLRDCAPGCQTQQDQGLLSQGRDPRG
mmetsp:Transcript_35478/g.93632  ORF Transcript_35478/g.93632 Transcript_35478/m.93632 type:complete len:550 (-) Transcript_35478:1896-3545(-)